MTRTDHTAPVPDLYLERYLLGELPEEERGRIERLVDLDPELRGRLDTLKRSDSEVAQRYPAREVAERIRGRARVEDAAAPSLGKLDKTVEQLGRAFGWRMRTAKGNQMPPLLAKGNETRTPI